MYQTAYYPLRTIIGDPIEIGHTNLEPNIRIIEESNASKELRLGYVFEYKSNLTATETDSNYKNYLPIFESPAGVSVPGGGMDSLPTPPDPLPFPKDTPIISLFALSNRLKNEEVSRQLSIKLHIKLARTSLVGGICFGGFPFLPYKLQDNGQNSANFGLPREIRLTSARYPPTFLDMGKTDGFMDFENSVTRQEIVSHSGFHYLQMDPTLTDSLILYLSDYPTFLTKFTLNRTREQPFPILEERYGFIIPYFYVFEYQENTRYKPRVPAGLLAARYEDKSSSLQVDYKHEGGTQRNKSYYEFTAASIFGQQRGFPGQNPISHIAVSRDYTEAFISKTLKPGEKIILYFQQAEEYMRCIAGIKVLFPFVPKLDLEDDLETLTEKLRVLNPNLPLDLSLLANVPREDLEQFLRSLLGIPSEVDFCEKIGIRVYELDPIEGVSPLLVPLDGKYASLLAERQVDELWEILLSFMLEGIRFIRPSTAKYFAIELTNLDDEPGQFMVRFLQLIQSAHVSIHPRASRTQQVSALHFRLIGPNLADDYALLGGQGFNFSVERLIAGERKNVLLQVNSLLDVLHTGAARIYSNHRRRKTEYETVEMSRGDGSFSEHETSNRLQGWSRSETGNMRDKQVQDDASWVNQSQKSDGRYGYTALNCQESRQRMEHIGKISDAFITALIDIGQNGLLNSDAVEQLEALKPSRNARLWETETGDIWTPWKCAEQISVDDLKKKLRVDGLWNSNIPPHFETIGSQLDDLVKTLSDNFLSTVPANIGALNSNAFITSLLAQLINIQNDTNPLLSALLLLNGISLSASPGVSASGAPLGVGVGGSVGLSLSASSSMPSLLKSSSVGSSGAITQQGNESHYSYAQYLNNRFDSSSTRTDFGDSKMSRLVTREPIAEHPQRVTGAEVMWQGQLNDILTGSIPLNFTLPATASKEHYRTADNSLRVRFGSGIGKSISVDFWFDILEEVIQDDY